MTKQDPEQDPEKSGDSSSKSIRADGHSRGEAISGLPDLGKSRKDLIAFLKAGGKSGISVDFGKPSIDGLVDDKVISKVKQGTQAERPAADYSFKATTAEQLQNAIAKSDKSKESLESVKFDDSELKHARLEPDKINAQFDAKLGTLDQQPASPAVYEERARVQSDKEYANARMEDNIQRLQTLERYHDKQQDVADKHFDEEKRLESARRVSLESTYAGLTADDYKRGYETQFRTFVVRSIKIDGIEEFVFSDGTVERFDSQTNTATFTERNGSIHIFHFNQCTYNSTPMQDGRILHESRSHNPAYDYTVISKGEHNWVAVDRDKKEIGLSKNGEVIKARQYLCSELESKVKEPEQLARIRANIAKLETRIHDPKELVQTYNQVSRLVVQNPRLNESRRLQLISELLSQAANPYTVDQGFHNTCNVSTIETTLYNDCPSRAASWLQTLPVPVSSSTCLVNL
jgi:hypothetical protein